MAQQTKTDTAEQFVGSVFKFSIATFANIIIYVIGYLLINFFVAEDTLGQVGIFNNWTWTIMTIGILGMDQALMRFYREPPAGADKNSLFRHCFYFSASLMLFVLLMGGTIFASPIYRALGFEGIGLWVVPLLLANATFYMVARYFNVLFRMEMNVRAYTIQSIAMQFFYKLFYLAGAFFPNPDVAMILFSAMGLSGFALVLIIIRRRVLRPESRRLNGGVYRTVLPFGVATAPSAVFTTLNGALPKSIIAGAIGLSATGQYEFAFSMSSIVTMVQGGFAAFWTPYVYANYKTHQVRIMKVHDFINFIILVFFSLLVIFEDVIFWVFFNYRSAMLIFPLTMLSAVFNILLETTVQGNAIARRPVLDTIGIGIGVGLNVLMCFVLIPPFGLVGAAVAVAIGNAAAYLFRTLTAQQLYRTIPTPPKTALALLVGVALTAAATVLAGNFWLKGLCGLAAIGVYCLMYRGELVRLWKIGISMLNSILKRNKSD